MVTLEHYHSRGRNRGVMKEKIRMDNHKVRWEIRRMVNVSQGGKAFQYRECQDRVYWEPQEGRQAGLKMSFGFGN